jgi:hypothetical protein
MSHADGWGLSSASSHPSDDMAIAQASICEGCAWLPAAATIGLHWSTDRAAQLLASP